jgi:hypothetical protein
MDLLLKVSVGRLDSLVAIGLSLTVFTAYRRLLSREGKPVVSGCYSSDL